MLMVSCLMSSISEPLFTLATFWFFIPLTCRVILSVFNFCVVCPWLLLIMFFRVQVLRAISLFVHMQFFFIFHLDSVFNSFLWIHGFYCPRYLSLSNHLLCYYLLLQIRFPNWTVFFNHCTFFSGNLLHGDIPFSIYLQAKAAWIHVSFLYPFCFLYAFFICKSYDFKILSLLQLCFGYLSGCR